MDMHQHDSSGLFRIVLRGELTAAHCDDLEHAWRSAQSILQGRDLEVDVAGLVRADAAGADLLLRMRAGGARLSAALPPQSDALVRSLGLPVAARRGRSGLAGVWLRAWKARHMARYQA